jgi:hypothetical protein
MTTPRTVGRNPYTELDGFTQCDVFMIQISNLANRRHAFNIHEPDFARRQLDMRVSCFFRNELCRSTGADAPSVRLFRPQFNVVQRRAQGNIAERKSIAHQNIGFVSGDNRHANLQSNRLKNVTSLAIRITKQRNKRRAVGIVFDSLDFCRDVRLIAFEINDAIRALVTTATMPN